MAIEANSRSFWENYLLSAQLCAGEGLRSQAQLKIGSCFGDSSFARRPDSKSVAAAVK